MILVTGCAGFIGFHLARKAMERGNFVLGLDDMNNYYQTELKWQRLKMLEANKNFTFLYGGLDNVPTVLSAGGFTECFHLAAQAGVAYSFKDPELYFKSNVDGFYKVMHACQQSKTRFIYASSSSVYGSNPTPWHEEMTPKPLSFYGSTKYMQEIMAEGYHTMFGMKSIGLRFFTVYGPWGRPDMSMWIFADSILTGKPLRIVDAQRDFTPVQRVVDITWELANKDLHGVFNVGGENPIHLTELVNYMQSYLVKKGNIGHAKRKEWDLEKTCADMSKTYETIGIYPQINWREYVREFLDWFTISPREKGTPGLSGF